MFTIIGLFYSLPAFAEATKKQCYKIIPVEQASLFPPYEIMCLRNTGNNPGDITFPYTHGEFSFFKVNEANFTAELMLRLTIPYQYCSKGLISFEITYGIDSSELSLFGNNFFINFGDRNDKADLFIGQYIGENPVGKKYNCSILEDELYRKYTL